jgi:hypothetical protein
LEADEADYRKWRIDHGRLQRVKKIAIAQSCKRYVLHKRNADGAAVCNNNDRQNYISIISNN